MVTEVFERPLGREHFLNQGRRPKPPRMQGDSMAQNHYTTKTKRRPKNSNRKDPSAATMAALRQLEASAKKSASSK